MTHKSHPSQISQIAWQAGRWLDVASLSLPLNDLGVLQGANVVDRIRTCGGQMVDLDWHLERFIQGVQALGLSLPDLDLRQLCSECVERRLANCKSKEAPPTDCSLVLLATPGAKSLRDHNPPTANLMLYTTELPADRLRQFYTYGQDLVCVNRTVIPSTAWSPQIKTRSRLHYYLGDLEANAQIPGAGALLLTPSGGIGDTSIANILVVKEKTIFTPPTTEVLQGVTLRRISQLASDVGLDVVSSQITPEFAFAADELLCSGTTAFLWPVRSLTRSADTEENEHRWAHPGEGKIYRTLSEQFQGWLGFDYQAAFTHQTH